MTTMATDREQDDLRHSAIDDILTSQHGRFDDKIDFIGVSSSPKSVFIMPQMRVIKMLTSLSAPFFGNDAKL